MIRFFKIYMLFLVITTVHINAASLNFIKEYGYENDYNKALQKAQKLNKPIMMILSTQNCAWCRKLERQTLKKDMINKIVSAHFIPLTLDRDHDNYPKKFVAKVVPTVFFIDPKNENDFLVSYGYKHKKVFKDVLLEATNKFQK